MNLPPVLMFYAEEWAVLVPCKREAEDPGWL